MVDYLILVNSITYALKGKDLLNKNGFRAYIIKTSTHSNAIGCSYTIYVPERVDEAISFLENAGIQVLGKVLKEGG